MKATTRTFIGRTMFLVLGLGLWTGTNGSRAQSVYEPYTFVTFAGSAGYGSHDGAGSAARFHSPEGVAVDSSGTIYVADAGNNTIRQITPAGLVTTLAGLAGSPGSANGTGTAARFNYPGGVAVDNTGTVYVADTGNFTIRRITSAGVVTTLAGLAGSLGSADGTGSGARFWGSQGVAVDSSGIVYVADNRNNTIRKITPTTVVTTLAGQAGVQGSADGTGSAARFNGPNLVAVDSSGTVYVADSGNNTIRKITSAGVVTTLAGRAGSAGSADGTGSAARFTQPQGVAVDGSGTLYVADGNDIIRLITPAGVVTTLAGQAGSYGATDGTGTAARFYGPFGVAVDSSGTAYVADIFANTIRRISPTGMATTLAGQVGGPGSGDGTGSVARFHGPQGVAVDSSGTVYVADFYNNTIRRITPAGVATTLAGQAGAGGQGSADGTGSAARFAFPQGVAVDASGTVYVADYGNSTIRQITPAGAVTTLAGLAGARGSSDGTGRAARFSGPVGVAVDGSGTVYVADTGNSTIRQITPTGVVTTLAGLAGNSGRADGVGSAARFAGPEGVAVDGSGTVYVADTGNNKIRQITPAGLVTTFAGVAGNSNSSGSADGTGSAARFNAPFGVAVDRSGTVYVGEFGNNTIRKITPAGVVTTLAGRAGLGGPGSADGTGSAARFDGATGVAVDGSGNVYVADYGNNTIRQGSPAAQVQLGISRITISGRDILIALEHGIAGYSYYALAATNVSTPRAQWTAIATNSPASNGPFTLTLTNALSVSDAQRYFAVQGE